MNDKSLRMKTAVRKQKPNRIREKARAENTDTDEGLLTTNQQSVIKWLQTSLGGA